MSPSLVVLEHFLVQLAQQGIYIDGQGGEGKQFVILTQDRTAVFTALTQAIGRVDSVVETRLEDLFALPHVKWDPKKIVVDLVDVKKEDLRNMKIPYNYDRLISGLFPELKLSQGQRLSRDVFVRLPLFQFALEVHPVFTQLVQLSSREDFLGRYVQFLRSLTREDWVMANRGDPINLALMSLYAYLDGKISREDLFVIQTVAEAERAHGAGEIAAWRVEVLTQESCAAVLTEAGFPPFAPNKPEFMITRRKSDEELARLKDEFIRRLPLRSPVQRTVVTYTLSPFLKLKLGQEVSHASVEMGLHYQPKCDVGFKNIVDGQEATVVLPPFAMVEDLYRMTSSIPLALIPEEDVIFGYNGDNAIFYKGRRWYSIASPLFTVPPVHTFGTGPFGLGIEYHDRIYHRAIEANNPDIDKIIEVAKAVEKCNPTNPLWREPCAALADMIVDREALSYRACSDREAFWAFLGVPVNLRMRAYFDSDEEHQAWKVEVILPAIAKVAFDLDYFLQYLASSIKNNQG
jgi:hypothetical protein